MLCEKKGMECDKTGQCEKVPRKLLVAGAETKPSKTFCVSSLMCKHIRNCSPEIFAQIGCAQINEAASGERARSPVQIILDKIQKWGGYHIEGPWFEKFVQLCLDFGLDPAKVENTAWIQNAYEKFGLRKGRAGDRNGRDRDMLVRA